MSRRGSALPSPNPLPASIFGQLANLDLQQLRARWCDLFGSPAPLTLRPQFLMQAIAWKLQVDSEGDIPAAMKRDLQLIAKRCREARIGGDRRQTPTVDQLPSAILQPGTRLVRVWRGDTYVIDVEDGGVRWNGNLYSSLSAAAQAITGTHWNGLLFFGLRRRKPPRRGDPPKKGRSLPPASGGICAPGPVRRHG